MNNEYKFTTLNELIEYLEIQVFSPIMDDDLWKVFGYKKRPQKGAYFVRHFPKRYEFDTFMEKEFSIMTLIDVTNGILIADLKDNTMKVLLGLVDHFLFMIKATGNDPEQWFKEYLEDYKKLKNKKTDRHHLTARKAFDELGKEKGSKYLVGVSKLFSNEDDYFALDSKIIAKNINEFIDPEVISNSRLELSYIPVDDYKSYAEKLDNAVIRKAN